MKDDVILIGLAALLLFAGAKGKGLLSPVRGRISSKFGHRETGFHNGVDIAVPEGTKVKTPLAGRVARIYVTEKGGKQMIIDHANGLRSGYAHLSKFYFGNGAKVTKGKVVALSGRTGIVTGPHLHFSWRKGDTYLNPAKHFRF